MPWTAPKTWATNETLTAANLNTYLRDDTAWLGTDKPRCRATRTATQAITSATDTAISLTGAETFDVGAMHDTVTNPSRITVPSGGGGVYWVGGSFRTEALTATRVFIKILANGVDEVAANEVSPPSGSGAAANVSGFYDLAAGEYIELYINHNDAASKNVTSADLGAFWVAT